MFGALALQAKREAETGDEALARALLEKVKSNL